MLAKDSVQVRLEAGLSFTEFSYMLIQATDYQHLHRTLGVELQMGGADQWGNITAGLELIRRTSEPRDDGASHAYAMAYPLLLSTSGAKFGKSEIGRVRLAPPRRHHALRLLPALAQHGRSRRPDLPALVHHPGARADRGARRRDRGRPERREAQRALATDITTRVHGAEAAAQATTDSEALFGPEPLRDPVVLARLHAGTRGFEVPLDPTDGTGDTGGAAVTVVAALADAGVLPSRGEARRLIQNGGLTINGEPIRDPAAAMPAPIGGEWWDVRIGKRRREIGRAKRA